MLFAYNCSEEILKWLLGIHGSALEVGAKEPLFNVEIEGSSEYLASGFQKLGLLSTFVSEELRSKIVDLQLAEAKKLGLGTRQYRLLNVEEG